MNDSSFDPSLPSTRFAKRETASLSDDDSKTRAESDGATAREVAAKRLQIGQQIAGRYEVIEQLGRGGFGAVYRARDLELHRHVAVKRANGLRSFVSGQIRLEAQSIASLAHPNIIAIYDLITIHDDELFIVMECPDGETLAECLHRGPFDVHTAVVYALQIAAALQHAHTRHLVHSDLKPANLLVAKDGRIRLLDFGLAVAYFPEPGRGGGTPGYMSPEQIRGESHLIDGRVDIWGLGVVIYEMLAGCRPFVGADASQTCKATLRNVPPPIRQLRPDVDSELERIILRCLEKRMSDRYLSASDVIEDLQIWQRDFASPDDQARIGITPRHSSTHTSATSSRLPAVGLQPFTEQDAESYLALVPGSRDRNGIPQSIQFWKKWVESDDAENDSPVGVLYGPSGSGKTSFVRAGLIQHLDASVCSVYVECRTGDLASKIIRIIESRLHERSTGSSLRDLLTRIRTDESGSRTFRKLLIILDQFESWSQNASVDERREFAEALRQCDGRQIRAIVVTRDDYWMSVSELLRWLEVPIREGRNTAAVELIDPVHGRRVLETIGRATGCLPAEPNPLSSAQQQFIRQAIEELTIGDSVIAVHLVIFAQMSRLREWSPRTLRHYGGVIGACSLYFQELFGSPATSGIRSPEYRRIAPAVIPILAALLPRDESEPISSARTKADLLQEVRQARCEHLFQDALRVLCEELRIVTVVDEDIASSMWTVLPAADATAKSDGDGKEITGAPRYRLSHDFLTKPLSEWIDRIRKRTWRGRKLARLAEVSEAWKRRPGRATMPGFLEFCTLFAASRLGRCNQLESEFIRAATRHHSGRISLAVIALLGFIGMSGVAAYQYSQAKSARARSLVSEVDLLLHGPPADVADHIATLQDYSADAVEAVQPYANSVDPQARIRAQLFLASTAATGSGQFASIAPLLASVPVELFDPLLQFARSASDASTVLQQIAADGNASLTDNQRAAVLLHQLGISDPIESLLLGSDDFDRDGQVWLETSSWRGSPERWIELLQQSSEPDVQYRTAVLLSTYPRSVLQPYDEAIDTAALINSPAAAVHSAGRLLEAHLGRDPAAIPLAPPADANWRVGPDNMPMVRLDAATIEYISEPNAPENEKTIEIKHPIWVSTIPVSRRLYEQFREETKTLPDGTEISEPRSVAAMPAALESDLSQPVTGINHPEALAFCNWLSERESLQPPYVYVPPVSENADPANAGDDQQTERTQAPFARGSIVPRRPPIPPWTQQESATGYRLLTIEEYAFIARCNYRRGRPWEHAVTLAQIGGDYEPPPGEEYPRPLYSLMPNRFGIFCNDPLRGSWIFTGGHASSAILSETRVMARADQSRPSRDHTIFLVQDAQ